MYEETVHSGKFYILIDNHSKSKLRLLLRKSGLPNQAVSQLGVNVLEQLFWCVQIMV